MSGHLDLQTLLRDALSQYDAFGLLWRKERRPDQAGWDIQEALRPHLLTSEMTHEWPGTKVLFRKQLYCTYKLVPASLSILAKATDLCSLFGDGTPEDLIFYKNGQVRFISITHEAVVWYAT